MRTFQSPLFPAVAAAAVCLLGAAAPARAQLSLQFSPQQRAIAASRTGSFFATLVNNGASEVFLNGLVFNPLGDAGLYLTADDSPFFANFPLSLAPGQSFSDELLRVSVARDAPLGLFAATVSILGGADGGALDPLAEQEFRVEQNAVSVPIVNPGFESAALPGDGNFTFAAPGWAIGPGADAGTYNPGAAQFPTAPGGAPQGSNVAFSSVGGPFLSQILTTPLAANTGYSLSLLVGDRADLPFGGYLIELRAGGQTLASLSSADAGAPIPGNGQFVPVSLFYDSPSSGGPIGQPLEVRFRSFGAQTNFDDVRLTAAASAVPEPGGLALALPVLAPLGLLAARRRRARG